MSSQYEMSEPSSSSDGSDSDSQRNMQSALSLSANHDSAMSPQVQGQASAEFQSALLRASFQAAEEIEFKNAEVLRADFPLDDPINQEFEDSRNRNSEINNMDQDDPQTSSTFEAAFQHKDAYESQLRAMSLHIALLTDPTLQQQHQLQAKTQPMSKASTDPESDANSSKIAWYESQLQGLAQQMENPQKPAHASMNTDADRLQQVTSGASKRPKHDIITSALVKYSKRLGTTSDFAPKTKEERKGFKRQAFQRTPTSATQPTVKFVDTLGNKHIGVDDDYYALGENSIRLSLDQDSKPPAIQSLQSGKTQNRQISFENESLLHLHHRTESFPQTLFRLLKETEITGQCDIVSFTMPGSAFCIHNEAIFVERLLPKYFVNHDFKTFQQYLNLYGFEQLMQGQDAGAYLHPLFQRDLPQLLTQIYPVSQYEMQAKVAETHSLGDNDEKDAASKPK